MQTKTARFTGNAARGEKSALQEDMLGVVRDG
jgi:hypothetical protein